MLGQVAKRSVFALLLGVTACATYAPPQPASPQSFSKDLPGSYDRTWSAVTFVAGASFYKIKAFEKASGLMTLDFDINDPSAYVDCGTVTDKASNQVLPAVTHLGLAGLRLTGSANITIRAESARQTAIQFNSQYDLVGFKTDLQGHPVAEYKWSFTSGSSATRNIPVAVTCRPSYKLEQGFLTEVAARL